MAQRFYDGGTVLVNGFRYDIDAVVLGTADSMQFAFLRFTHAAFGDGKGPIRIRCASL